MNDEQGFSLVELLIVVAIISLIAAIAVPNLVRAREAADSASAVASVRTLITAENLYYNSNAVFADLTSLDPAGLVDPQLASGAKSDYTFTITVTTTVNPDDGFTCLAEPVEGADVLPFFYTDQTGVIRVNYGGPASSTSSPI